jgi:ribose transport system substrate-binding protein
MAEDAKINNPEEEIEPVRLNTRSPLRTRRGFIEGMGALGLMGLLAACGDATATPAASAQGAAQAVGQSLTGGKRLKAAFSNAGLGATWCAQGKDVAENWGKWFGVDVTWYDGGLSVDTQRKAIDDMAARQWDFVAIQPFGIDTLIDPVKQMIDKGIPVIQMDTRIDSQDKLNITTFLEPDNVYMGSVMAETLFQKMGGKGTVIETWGALGHTGAQGRDKGFQQTLQKYPDIKVLAQDPADWDVNKVAQLWENYLVKFKDIGGGFFHNDDMALAASKVVKNANRNIPLTGIDAMQPAIAAVADGTLLGTVRNPSGRIHWGAMVVGILAATGTKDIPKYILADGPIVNQKNAAGLTFMENKFFL